MRTASSQATREGQQARLCTIHDLDAAAQVLSEACQVVLDEIQDPVTLRERIYACVPGVTYLNYTSDQFTGLGGLVIPGTIRDSVYVLECRRA